MPNLYMGDKAFRFEQVVIDRLVQPGDTGNYALGIKDEAGEFIPKVIGRSDTDLKAELTAKLETKYPYFKFSTGSPKSAYELECAHFHGFQAQLDSKKHPTAPEGTDQKCFLCGL
jgi:hypothetical protein